MQHGAIGYFARAGASPVIVTAVNWKRPIVWWIMDKPRH